MENEVQNLHMYRVRLDKAGENSSNELNNFVNGNSIITEYFPAYAIKSKVVYERCVQDIWEMARTMLFASELSLELLAEAVAHAV